MESVGAYEAKTHLSQLLNRVAEGEEIEITRHGVPVAVLAPPRRRSQAEIRQTIEELKKFAKKHPLKGLSIREMIEEGRR